MSDKIKKREVNGVKCIQGLQHGIYEIYWKSGGSSLASVGYDQWGNNWYMPVNWLNTVNPPICWYAVTSIKLLIANDYTKKTKSIKVDYPKIDLP